MQLKDTLQIGDLEGSFTPTQQPAQAAGDEPTVDDDDWEYEEPKKESSPYLPLFIGLGVLVYAVLFYYVIY